MFPAASRAFAPVAPRFMLASFRPRSSSVSRISFSNGSSRSATTAQGGEYKTVVDICREKIESALETDTVEVKGACRAVPCFALFVYFVECVFILDCSAFSVHYSMASSS